MHIHIIKLAAYFCFMFCLHVQTSAGATSQTPIQSGSISGDGSASDPLLRPTEIGTIVGTVFTSLALVVAIVFGINGWKKGKRAIGE